MTSALLNKTICPMAMRKFQFGSGMTILNCKSLRLKQNVWPLSWFGTNGSVRFQMNSTTKMLAWQINEYGGNEKLKLVEKPIPTITQPDQVLIKVYASSVNPIDFRMRNGYGATLLNKGRRVKPGGEFPLTLGRDCSGVVADMGKGVTGFEVGQEVWATVNGMNQGAHAQYVLTTSKETSPKPKNLTHVEAASMPYVAITTWSATYAVARLRPENAVGTFALVHGGAGGIGSFAIQLLKAWNVRVATTCSTDAVDFVRSIGADHVVDYRTTDPETELKKLGRFEYILDTIGGKVEDYSLNLLNGAKGANYITLVTPLLDSIESQGAVLGSLSASLTLMKKALQTARLGGKYRWAFATANAKALAEVAELVHEGKIRPVVNKVFPFTEAPDALRAVEDGHARGKTVIRVAQEDQGRPATKVDIFKDP